MKEANVKVDIKLRQIERVWKVDLCVVWHSPDVAMFLQSGNDYPSADAAIAEMKRRAMQYLRKSGRTETEQQVLWQTISIAADGTVIGNDEGLQKP